MDKISQRQQVILSFFLQNDSLGSSDVHEMIERQGTSLSLVTIKREISDMVQRQLLMIFGKGRSRVYRISSRGRLYCSIDAHIYCTVEPDKRYGMNHFNFDLFPQFPTELFTSEEGYLLGQCTDTYRLRTKDLPIAIQKKELERFIIELSWKSSKIEGNTYTLLDTEKLILEHTEAVGHDKKEATMILNHKYAFTFVRDNVREFRTITRVNLETVHALIVKDLDVGCGLRQTPVGVVGSAYRPLDNVHQIKEAVDALAQAVEKMSTPYAKALLVLLGVSYIQPFEDGNKRTARIMANALLMAYDCAPMSYRSVDEVSYREACLVFYELNSMVPLKDIFLAQYEFAALQYVV